MTTLVKGRGDIPIVLCCAEDDEAALAKVVDEMRREGMSPELVPGVEFDGAALTNAVDAAPPDALFVLCQSAALERTTVRRLTGLFSARGGPGQRVVTAAFTPSRPLAILPSIRVALKEMRLAGETPEEPREPSSHLRDVVEALTDANQQRVPVANSSRPLRDDDAETLARELALGLAEAEAILERRADHADATPRPRRDRRASSDPVPVPRAPEPVRAPTPVLPSTVETVRGVAPVTTREVHGVTTDPEESTRLPRRTTPVIPDAPLLPPEPRGNRWLLVFAGLGVAGMVALALMQVISSGNEVPPVDEATRSRPAALREPATAPPVREPVQVADPTALPAPTEPAVPKAPERPVPPPVEDPPVADTPTNSEKVPPAPPKAMSKRDAETAALLLAAAEGKVSRVGRLFVVRGGEESLTWDEAVAFCRSRKVAGVAGFRLPGRNELRRLKAAGLLGAATFWSRNKGESGDDAFAIDGASGAENLYLLIEPSGRVACIHE